MRYFAIRVVVALLCATGAVYAQAQPFSRFPSPEYNAAVARIPTPKELDEVKRRMALLTPSMDPWIAETNLGILPFTEDRMSVYCTGPSYSDTYYLKGGKRLFMWREAVARSNDPVELIKASLFEEARREDAFTVWVKPEHEYYARIQTNSYAELGTQALSSDHPRFIATVLEFLVTDHPSGTWQVTGSELDAIVEQTRRTAIAGLIGRLRQLDEEDLGTDPQKWIHKYAR